MVGDEVVLPGLLLAHQLEGVVDRVLHDLSRDRRHEGDLVGHLSCRLHQVAGGHDPIDHPETPCLGGVDPVSGEEELLGLADAELPRLDEELDAGARHSQDGVLEHGVFRGDDEVAHARQHQAGGDAAALHGGDRRLAEVVDLHAPVEVHDLLVAALAFGGLPQPDPLVGLTLAHECLEVVAGGEMTTGAGEDDDANRVVCVGGVEGGVQVVDERRVLGVGHLGTVHRDRRYRSVDIVEDRRQVHLVPPSQAPAGAGSLGRPRTRSAMMLRWISFVPAKMDAAW